jgi:outer membrane protein OmpA-like peptidoglycan-associated protein
VKRAWLAAVLTAGAAPLTAQAIPIQAGMSLTYVHRNFHRNRDDEIRTWIVRVSDSESVWSAEWVADPCPGPEDHMSRREQAGAREMDFARGGTMDQTLPERHPHTLFMLSRRILRLLTNGEVADMIEQVVWTESVPGDDKPAARCHFSQLSSQLVQGQLTRVGADTTGTVIVDGRAVTVPLLHAHGDFLSMLDNFRMQGDMWFVDDTLAPWVTRIEMTRQDGRTFHMALGTVTTPAASAAMERALTDSCRAPVYGFYFAFNSSEVEPASAPTFRAVADLLGRHPDWTLAIEGHTDSVGDPAANLRLSERRANAVRQQLVAQYGVATGRLSAAGRGMNGYVASNNTLAGRARNRRVDLVRRCGG